MADAVFYIVETGQPVVEVDAGIAQGFDAVVGNVVIMYFFKETGGVQPLHAAVVVGDDHDFFDFKFEHGDQKAAHDRPPRMGNDRTGVFDELGIAVFQSERVGQQLDDARVHAGQDGEFAAGIFVSEIFFVFARFDKILVIGENFAQFAHGVVPPTECDDYSLFRTVWLCSVCRLLVGRLVAN